jgi:hypothetical protein
MMPSIFRDKKVFIDLGRDNSWRAIIHYIAPQSCLKFNYVNQIREKSFGFPMLEKAGILFSRKDQKSLLSSNSSTYTCHK